MIRVTLVVLGLLVACVIWSPHGEGGRYARQGVCGG